MNFRERVYELVAQIPEGKVATYGQIATLAGRARWSRACGHVLRTCEVASLPWHRVINAQGTISPGGDLARPEVQRHLLEAEGVQFRRSGACDLARHRWEGPADALPWEPHDPLDDEDGEIPGF